MFLNCARVAVLVPTASGGTSAAGSAILPPLAKNARRCDWVNDLNSTRVQLGPDSVSPRRSATDMLFAMPLVIGPAIFGFGLVANSRTDFPIAAAGVPVDSFSIAAPVRANCCSSRARVELRAPSMSPASSLACVAAAASDGFNTSKMVRNFEAFEVPSRKRWYSRSTKPDVFLLLPKVLRKSLRDSREISQLALCQIPKLV